VGESGVVIFLLEGTEGCNVDIIPFGGETLVRVAPEEASDAG
jgi:hypothetical protein